MKNLIKVIYLPPPNITGKLHVGHALNYILTDILVRKTKLLGYKLIWIPGLDHAGISTQILIEKYLINYGIDKKKLNKAKFTKFIKLWKNKYSTTIIKQIKNLNISLNWKLKYFTLNKKISKLIKKIFLSLYKKNLIKKKLSIINWDPILKSSTSDFEIIKFFKYTINFELKYFYVNRKGFVKNFINNIKNLIKASINITNNKNLKNFYKKKLNLPFTNNKFSYILYKNFCCLKFLVYFKKNFIYKNLKFKFINLHLYLNFKKLNILNLQFYKYILINKSIRNKSILKLRIKNQWFVLIKKHYINFKTKLITSLKKIILINNLKLFPNKWNFIYKNWIKNLNNWCISRQIWWGHKIPIFYKQNLIFIINNYKKRNIYKIYKSSFKNEADVLDTWFSSALIPIISKYLFKNRFNYKKYIQSEILITGYDIIFFWVIKMIIFSLYFLKKLPFKNLYIHGLIVDNSGKKMSKSIGNTLNPIDLLINFKIKTDILRFILSSLITKNKFIKFNITNYYFYQHFYNKLLNIASYIYKNCLIYKHLYFVKYKNNNYVNLYLINYWILYIIEENKIIIEKNYKYYKLYLANKIIYKLIKILYSNWFIEISKLIIKNNSMNKKYQQCIYILYSFYELLKILYPFMPDITNKLIKFLNKLLKIYNIIINHGNNLLINYLSYKFEPQFINKNIKSMKLNYFKIIKLCRNNNINNLTIIILYVKNFKFINFIKYTKNLLKFNKIKLITNLLYFNKI